MGEGHVGPVVCEVADGDGGGAVGKDIVLDLKDLPGHLRRGDGDGVEAAEAEVDDAAVLAGEPCQAPVGQLVHHPHVSDDRERPRPRREALPSSLHCHEEEEGKREKEEEQVQWLKWRRRRRRRSSSSRSRGIHGFAFSLYLCVSVFYFFEL